MDVPAFSAADGLVIYAGDGVPGLGHVLLMESDPSPVACFSSILMGR